VKKKKKKTNTVAGNKVPEGERMKTGKGWRVVGPNNLSFKATLIRRMKIGKEDVAVFRLLTHPVAKKRKSKK
jgi:hypothetical protein